MFGHQNDQQQQDQQPINQEFVPPADSSQPVAAATQDYTATQPQFSPPSDSFVAPPGDAPAPVIISDQPNPSSDSLSAPLIDTEDNSPMPDTNALLDIKQQALNQLSPLVGHLDQTPEEKFRTTMMMIQASDNQRLIQDAYDAAQAISDEKTKAQALLDVINEINYFTQHAA